MEIPKHRKPPRPSFFFRTLIKIISLPDLIATRFKCKRTGMDRLGKREPALFLMNHSCFLDLEIAESILYPRPFNIVATLDAFVGKEWLMNRLGCISTRKFVFDIRLVKDISHCIKKQNRSVLMFPEAGYSLDGRATTLPDSLAKFIKMLGAPVVMIETFGAYHRQPLYNELRKRKVKVSCEMRYLLSPDEIKEMDDRAIADVLAREFSFDAFKWQQENRVKIDEPSRAEGLHRLLYKCPACSAEGKMTSSGAALSCSACGSSWELDEYGTLTGDQKSTEFSHVPDWYDWERECVRRELEADTYGFSEPVDIYMLVNSSGIYNVGDGVLTHSKEGFHLVGCDGQLDYSQNSISMYSLNSDYYWYKLGDVIGIGDHKALYYCIPRERGHVVTKARLATEEIFNSIKR